MRLIFKSKLPIFQLKANLDDKNLSGLPYSTLVHNLVATEIKILFPKVAMELNLNFNDT